MKTRMMTEKELSMSEFLHLFTFEESVKIAYVPILLTEASFRYAETVARLCAAKRLPYVKDVRVIRENIALYRQQSFGLVSAQVMHQLEEQIKTFFSVAATDVQTFWFVVNQELKKRYPELDEEYELLTYLYMCISILRYVRKFEISSDIMMSKRLSKEYRSLPNPYSTKVWKALEKIADKYKVDRSDMINLSLRVIRNKVDGLLAEQIKEYEQRQN